MRNRLAFFFVMMTVLAAQACAKKAETANAAGAETQAGSPANQAADAPAFTAGSSPAGSIKEGDLNDGLYALMSTTKGDILLRLYFDQTPMTVANFVALAEGTMNAAKGKPFYDGLTFHRVISKANGDDQDFMIQGGDPQGNGSGGPGYKFPDEIDATLKHDAPGTLAMANAGPGTNGSQFFITIKETPWLNGRHTVFGRVVEGQNVVDTMKQGDKINTVKIIRKGAAAEAFKPDQAMFDKLVAEHGAKAQAAAKAEQEKQLALIKQKFPNAKEGPQGIRYVITKEGSGPKPKKGDKLKVNYAGSLLSGQKFDEGTLDFEVDDGFLALIYNGQKGRVIPGWDLTVLDMKPGEKRTVVLPPDLAYGDAGAGGVIPPNAWLIFDMEIVK